MGIKAWFGEKVQKVFEESTNVANAYLNVHYQNIRSDLNNILIHPREFLPIEDNDDNVQLYKRAIKKSKSEWKSAVLNL